MERLLRQVQPAAHVLAADVFGELDADLKPIKSSYLGDAEEIARAAAAVAAQGKAK